MRIGVDERRARLGRRHLLAVRDTARDRQDPVTPERVADDLVALHATDPATVHLAVAARTRSAGVTAVERALYEDRTLVRMLGMRRTMFVVTAGTAAVVHAGCTLDIAVRQRKLLEKQLAESGVGGDDPGTWLKDVEESTVRALAARGSAGATELAGDEPRLREQIVGPPGKDYVTKQYLTTRVLFQLSADGRIVRGRPRGSWTSSQHLWSTMDTWLPGPVPDVAPDAARVELARRWLGAYGPATVADLRWWTGWTAGQAKKALTAIGPVEVDLDGVAGLVLPDDLPADAEPTPDQPWVALLPALDPTPMGWSHRDWFLGGHAPSVFDRTGNIGPTVWWDGRIVGGWAQRTDGEVVYRLLEDVGADVTAAVAAEAARLTGWLGQTRVTARFRTPLERELTS